MTVNFTTASQIGYIPTVTVGSVVSNPVKTEQIIKADTLEKSKVNEKENKTENSGKTEKKSLFSKISTFIGGIKKFFASVGEYTKGIVKGLVSGAVAGAVVYTLSSIVKAVKKQPKNTLGVVAAVGVAAGTFVYNIYKSYLNTNNAHAEIDHRYR